MNTQKLRQTFAAFGLTFDLAANTYKTTKLLKHRSRCAELARNMAAYPELKEMFYKEFLRA